MAGASLTINVDDAEARELVARILTFSAEPMRLAFADAGEFMLRSTRERAAREETPDGIPWVELSEVYKEFKDKKRPGVTKLKFDMHMLGDQFSYQVGDGLVDIGTNAIYGAIHQWGGTEDMAPGPAAIPARTWLGASDDDVVEILAIFGDHLELAIRG